MKLTKRRVTVGVISAAVVVTMTSVTTWALADTKAAPTNAGAPVRLVVGYKTNADRTAATRTLSAAGATKLDASTPATALEPLRASSVQVSSARSASMIAALRSDPNVSYVEVDQRRQASLVPNDETYQAGKQPEIDEVRAPLAWDTTTGGSTPVKIAVVDSGVNPVGDLAGGAVLAGYDFVNNDSNPADDAGHGTSVAALIAARGNNAKGMAGLCWTCQIVPVKVLDREGGGWDSDVAAGVTYAVQHGAKIINMSLGGSGSSKVLSDAVAYANTNGVLVVAAAGNKQTTKDPLTTRSYPAAYGDVVAVAATAKKSNALAPYSYRNKAGDNWVDLAAPGTVTSMDRLGNYSTDISGTSFAAPIVAGIAGLIKANNPSFTGWSLMQALQASAGKHKIGSGVNYGKIDAADALTFATDTTAPKATGTLPAQNALVRGTVTVTPAGISDNWSGIRNVNLYVNGVFKGYANKAPFGVPLATGAYNGATKVQLRIWDKAGNTVSPSERTLVVDNVPPSVKITSAPKSGSKISGTVTVKFAVSDAKGIKVTQLLINGKVSQQRSTTTPFTFSAGSVSNGVTVQVRAYDKTGNSALSAKYTYKK
jgi:subtilisin family serine protease